MIDLEYYHHLYLKKQMEQPWALQVDLENPPGAKDVERHEQSLLLAKLVLAMAWLLTNRGPPSLKPKELCSQCVPRWPCPTCIDRLGQPAWNLARTWADEIYRFKRGVQRSRSAPQEAQKDT